MEREARNKESGKEAVVMGSEPPLWGWFGSWRKKDS